MVRMIFFFICAVIALLLTCTPKKCGIAGYLAGIVFITLCGMPEVYFFHAISKALDHTGIFIFSAGAWLGFQWLIWSLIRPSLTRMYAIFSALIFLFSL